MSRDVVFTLSLPKTPVDARALIDRAFSDEPVRQAAKAIVTKLLTDGEMAQYQDGRGALYLETDRRPAVQALVDGMSTEDRQRLLALLYPTELAPALEGFILGRWPSRGFLLESRTVFRLPELSERLTVVPNAAFREKLNGAKKIIQERSPGSPSRALFDLLARVERDTPRLPSGVQVRWDAYTALCRSDPPTLALAGELSRAFQDTSVALFRALAGASSSYLPQTSGGTNGGGEELSGIDRADIADYCDFLCCVAFEFLIPSEVLTTLADHNEMTGHARTCVLRSVLEALLVTFLQRRFSEMTAPVDAEVESDRPRSAEESERQNRQYRRKQALLLQTLSLLAAFREAALALPRLFVREDEVRTGPLLVDMLDALGNSVANWATLRAFSDFVSMPRTVMPVGATASAFRQPLPDLAILRCRDVRSKQPPSHPLRSSYYITATYCRHLQDTVVTTRVGWQYPGKWVGATVGMHTPEGGACLSHTTYIPVRQFLHPEDPASIVATFLVRQVGGDVQEIMEWLRFFEVEQQVREAVGDVPRLDLLHLERVVRRRLFFWRKRTKHFVYLVMRRQDAIRLGILARVCVLPPREQALLRDHFRFCPEEPVCLRTAVDDGPDDDGGGGPEPPKPPPAPEEREEPEDAPTRQRVGVG